MELLWFLLSSSLSLLLFYLNSNSPKSKSSKSTEIIHLGDSLLKQLFQFGLRQTTNTEYTRNVYNKMKRLGASIAWTSFFGHKTLTITDLNLIKHITIKDFDHFSNRQSITMAGRDKTLGKVLTSRVGQEWKVLRSKMSPTFTAGKIKRMFSIFDENSKKLVKFLSTTIESDLTVAHTKMTTNIIASTVCGLSYDAFDTKEYSTFEKMGLSTPLEFGRFQVLKMSFMGMFPNLGKLLGFSIFSKGAVEFFTWIFKGAIRARQERGEKGDDFIQLLLEARQQVKNGKDAGKAIWKLGDTLEETNNNEINRTMAVNENESNLKILLDDESIVSNCFIFIFAGFDTTQSVLSYSAYSLALHPDIQDRLRKEILEESQDEGFTYENIAKMKYLGMVVNETLRMYSPVSGTNRICNEDYRIPETDLVIKKGQRIAIPIIGFHHDKEYFPNPERFWPERFAPENLTKESVAAFMPFGNGPRNCIGMRFAMIEIKLALAHLVRSFSIQPSSKTMIPMKYSSSASLQPDGGMWLSFNKI